jgi:NAD(P)-dependent dehydrogenase (short-subunit alcohol dehydrogenase family)
MHRQRRFAGSTALVTGGASGIGRALGAELAAQGAQVVLADIDALAVQRTARKLAGSVEGCGLDVRDEAAFRSLVDAIVHDHGRLDLLFNNAGIAIGGPTHELTAAHWEHAIDVNIRGVVHGVLAAYPAMVERGAGDIVNTASGAGLVAPPFVAPYAMTKHAVVGLSLGLRPEAARHGVNVSVLCPGAVETAILDRVPPADLPLTPSEPVTARAYLEVARQTPVSADQVARRAVQAVARKRGIIVIPARAKSLWYLQRVSPALADRACRVVAGQVQRRLIRPRR